jgi:putative PEP-CTERM system TPR-repeat lipoprotein
MRELSFFHRTAVASLFVVGLLTVSWPSSASQDLEKARGYIEQGEMKSAIIELKSLLQEDPGDGEARLLLGEVYLELNAGAEAEKELRRAADLGAPPSIWRLKLIDSLLLQRKFSDMLDVIDEAGTVEDPKTRAELEARRGRALSGLERHDEAEAAFARALEVDPNNEQAALGRILIRLKGVELDAAADDVDAFLEQFPNNPEMLLARGEIHRRHGELDKAIELYTRARKQLPEDVRPVVGQATVLIAQGKLDEAKSNLDRADEISRDTPMVLYLRGLVAFQEKDWELAQAHLERVLGVMPGHVQSQLILGVISFSRNDLQIAEEYLSKVVSALPAHLHAVKILAATRIKMREPKRAIEILEPITRNSGDPQLMALLGSAYMLEGDEAEGQDWLSRAVELSPDAAALRTQFALTLLAGGNTEGAINELQAAVDLGQDVLQADVLLVLAHLKKKQYEQAVSASQALEERHPDRAVPYNLTGLAYLAQEKHDLAEERFNQALEVDPGFVTALMNLARLDVARNDLETAQKRYETVLEKQPQHLGAMMGLAALAERRKDAGTLLEWLERAQDANPASVQPGLAIALHHLKEGDVLQGLAVAVNLSVRFPDNPKVLEILARTQLLAGEETNAVRTLERLSNQNPENHMILYLVGSAKMKSGDLVGARRAFRDAVDLKPEFIEARYQLAIAENEDGRTQEALDLAKQLRRDFPESPVGAALEGRIHLDQKRPDDAATALEAAFALRQTSDIVLSLANAYLQGDRKSDAMPLLEKWTADHSEDARALAFLAQLFQTEGRDAEAARTYEAVLATGQRNVVILNNLAWIYQKVGDERAVEIAREAYDLEPSRPEVADTYGWVLLQSGNVKDGLSILQQAYVAYPMQAEIGYHVAVGLKEAGRNDEAMKILRRLLRETPNFEQANQARALLSELESD